MVKRVFRTPESYEAEQTTRGMIAPFLTQRGFAITSDRWIARGQTIEATDPSGTPIMIRVRQCWRRGENDTRGYRPYAAAQVLADVTGDDWEGSMEAKAARDGARHITHYLFVQREGAEIVLAALIRREALPRIWSEQRRVYARLIAAGQMGGRRSNPAENGRSPTLYLEDDLTPEATVPLWSRPEVIDVGRLPIRAGSAAPGPRLRSAGAGYGDPERNRMIEQAAIGLVRGRYEEAGWTVTSVERDRCGFDLYCVRGAETEHVEVKGVGGSLQAFNITRNEVGQARRDAAWRLVVVTGCDGAERAAHTYTGPAFLESFELDPLQYRAGLLRPASKRKHHRS